MARVLAIDIGSSSIRATVYGQGLQPLRPGAQIHYRWRSGSDGSVEASAATMERAVASAIDGALAGLRSEVLAEFRQRAKEELIEPFAELVHAAAEPFVTVIADGDVPTMRVGRFVLIGDAAITPRPHAAAGAAKAAGDAWDLATALTRSAHDPWAGLSEWEARRLAVGRAYLEKVRRMGGVLQNGALFAPGDPANRFGLADAGRP